MKLTTLLEDKREALKLQQQLIDELDDDFEIDIEPRNALDWFDLRISCSKQPGYKLSVYWCGSDWELGDSKYINYDTDVPADIVKMAKAIRTWFRV